MAHRRLPAALLAALVLASLAPAASATEPPPTTVEGTLELEISDHVDAKGRLTGATYHYAVRDERGRRTEVTFPGHGEPPAGVESGAKVRIKGQRTATGVAAEGNVTVLADAGSTATGSTTASTSSSSAPTTVTRRLAVLLVNFASNPIQPYTTAYANGIFFTNTNSVAAFYAEESYGGMTLSGDVTGWYTIQYDTRTCDTAAIQSRADAAATAAGVVLSEYTHISYVFPHLNACSFAGRAQLPGSRSWINTLSTTSPYKLHDWVIAHELGHNFGVHHANSYSCSVNGTRVALAAAADCTSTEYGDPHTVMGAWNPPAKYPHSHAWHRLQMGFIAPAERKTVTVSGLYTIGATNYDESAPKALRIDRGTSAIRHWLELEFRQPGTLFDGFASTAPVVNGPTIRLVADDDVRTQSWLVDSTPGTTTFSDAPLAVGKTLTDPRSGIAITAVGLVTDAAGHRAVKVKVVFPNTPPPSAPPAFEATSSNDGQTATLSWGAATTPVGVAGYRIYRDDVRIGTVAGAERTFIDPDRVPGTSYSYRVEAVDWIDLVGAPATTSLLMKVPELGTTTASFAGPSSATARTSTDTADAAIVTRATTISFGLQFSAPVTDVTTDSVALGGTATGCTVAGVTGAGTEYTVSVAGCSEGTLSASIAAGAVWDEQGYLAPALDATSDTVLIDRTAPSTAKPKAQLREGSRMSGKSAPVRIGLGGSDASSGVASYDVARSVDGGAWATVLSATSAASFDTTLASGHTYRFRVRTRDAAGNVSGWVESSLFKPGLTQNTSSAITWRGTWSTGKLTLYSGGSARYTKSSSASASYTFTGRGIALVTTKASGRGMVKVYIDGVYVRTVDLYRSSVSYRVLAFAQMFTSVGTHTIRLVPVVTSSRPRVDLDAFAVIR